MVREVRPESWASESGVRVGDIVLSATSDSFGDGESKDFSQLSATEKHDLLQRNEARPLTLKVVRGRALDGAGGRCADLSPRTPRSMLVREHSILIDVDDEQEEYYTFVCPEGAKLGFTYGAALHRVSEVKPGGWADEQGIIRDEVLVKLNGTDLARIP